MMNLEKKEGYFFTEEELKQLIGDAFEAGVKRYQNTPKYTPGSVDITFEEHPSKEQYITSILTPTTQP